MEAKNNPVRTRHEANSANHPIGKLPDVNIGLDKPLERSVIIDASDFAADALQKDYLDQLAFNEEPVTIVLTSNQEKNPPPSVECWVQGKGIEFWINGGWVAAGYAPFDVELTTKRKYIEVLLGSKIMRIDTVHDDATVAMPRNIVKKATTANVSVTIIEDKNTAKGLEWLRRMRARPV